MGPNKYVHVMFAVGTLVVAFLLAKTTDWVWSYFAKPNDLLVNAGALLVGVATGVALYRNERVFAGAVDVTRELEKVTWPTRKETYAATIVVIVTVSIASLILTGFDFVWSKLAGLMIK